MNQSWENCKKNKQILGLILVPFGPDLVLKMFFWFYVYWMLDIVASYHCMQFQGQLMNQTWENGKKPSFGPILVHLPEIRATKFFFFKNRDLSVTRYHGQLSSCAISEKTNDPILRKLSDGRTPKKILHGKNQRLSKKQISKYEELTFTIRIKKQFSWLKVD